MSQRQYVITAIASILVLLAGFGLFKLFGGMKKETKPERPPVIARKVQSSHVSYQDLNASFTASGRVVSQQSVAVISEVQGKLLSGDVNLRKGSSFNKGDVLVKIYNTDALYTLQSKKSAFLNSLATILPDLKIDYPDAYNKWVDFFEKIEIEKNLPQLPKIESSQEKIFLASRGILGSYYSIKSDEVKLSKYTLYAPFDGAIEAVSLEPGSVANPGSRIANIIRTRQLEIEVPLEVGEAEWVKIGQSTEIKDDKGHKIGSGRVARISKFVDPSNQSINVYIQVLPGSGIVMSGQYLNVKFKGMTIYNAMELPRNAVFNTNMVYIVENGFLVKREINVIKVNQESLYFNGLDVGTEIVVQPLTGVNANMPVQTEFSKPSTLADSDSIPGREKERSSINQ